MVPHGANIASNHEVTSIPRAVADAVALRSVRPPELCLLSTLPLAASGTASAVPPRGLAPFPLGLGLLQAIQGSIGAHTLAVHDALALSALHGPLSLVRRAASAASATRGTLLTRGGHGWRLRLRQLGLVRGRVERRNDEWRDCRRSLVQDDAGREQWSRPVIR
eukprot:scaffold273721_cov36-Tisochrysis_lutea.AAC.4